ncbi:1-deoxy-D-xylulose-5-phosphate synthase [Caldisalinibacter kiritimatiensis]|uniref:1-deoxy-D-xylulose-5-phosphate synthase n=1 Tax=Caldisalinibacter kiritimatiensis TaxID=1304284 RepID=R1AWZ3_9FIRM|nr:1-deoxy-D-xylulose-5-phosphate synthase [Caldisalinibacter kiritimatiensis]EOD01723.1 1-deoxy-D-xylulose 5-phosphate synthase [Caldisalinibacter kiritimatiensis]
MNKLSSLSSVKDIKNMNISDLNNLSSEIRQFIIETVSETGGHLASNLGVVELTLALHKVFDSPKDKIIWDVGHQAYVHKIITGRKEEFKTIRQYKGLSGFPKRSESEHDIFETGHSSTSISAGLGLALARDIKKEDYHVVCVIGDGAMTAGMAFEALNHAGDIKTNMIVVLNDNEMSISENVGGLSRYLNKIRTEPTYFRMKEDIETILNSIPAVGKKVFKTAERAKDSVKYFLVPGMLFESLGFKYLGPVDGHNIKELINVFKRSKYVEGPVLIHAVTKKGKGYKPAEENPDKYHSASPFVIETGKAKKKNSVKKYSQIVGETLVKIAEKDEHIVAITAAMPSGTGLDEFKEKFSKRFFDVGIAEQHGVTLAAGLATNGMKPVFAVYSTFLQRGYDQLLHDVCLQNLPVVFAIDRAGLVGADGETHHGVFDLSYLTHIPNMAVLAPKDGNELAEMLKFAINYNGPIAIRYPRGQCADLSYLNKNNKIEYGNGEILKKGKEIAVIAVGRMVEYALKASNILEKEGITPTLINARFVKPVDKKLIKKIAKEHKTIITIEDNVKIGGFGSKVVKLLNDIGYEGNVDVIALPDKFIQHGNVEQLFKENNLDVDSIANTLRKKFK